MSSGSGPGSITGLADWSQNHPIAANKDSNRLRKYSSDGKSGELPGLERLVLPRGEGIVWLRYEKNL
jgi:hypothetical protein